MWIAGKAQKIRRGGKTIEVKPGEPIPEAENWPNRQAWERQGFIRQVADMRKKPGPKPKPKPEVKSDNVVAESKIENGDSEEIPFVKPKRKYKKRSNKDE